MGGELMAESYNGEIAYAKVDVDTDCGIYGFAG